MGSPVVIRADATPAIGSGHVLRVLGLVDELRLRDHPVVLLGRVTIPWVRDLLGLRGLVTLEPPETAAEVLDRCRALGARTAVLDGYALPPDLGAVLRSGGLRVLALRDGTFGADQECDVALDQNLGSEDTAAATSGVLLAGARYTLFRDEVLRARPVPWPGRSGHPRLLAFFGGSDPFGAAEVLAPVVLAGTGPVDLCVVTPDAAAGARIAALPRRSDQSVTVSPTRPDLLGLARSADLVVTATGGSVWELLLHDVPFACVQVADNQEVGYRELVDRGLAAGLGSLTVLRTDAGAAAEASRVLTALAADPARREALARPGRGLVDGRGRVRVVDTLLSDDAPRPARPAAPMSDSSAPMSEEAP